MCGKEFEDDDDELDGRGRDGRKGDLLDGIFEVCYDWIELICSCIY